MRQPVPESVAKRYGAIAPISQQASRRREAFSWDGLTTSELNCGYMHGNSTGKLKIPDIPEGKSAADIVVGLPFRWIASAHPISDEKHQEYTAGGWHGRKQTYFQPVLDDNTHVSMNTGVAIHPYMNDHDFMVCHAIIGSMMHSASDQPMSVAAQPDWVCFAMNSGRIATYAAEGYNRWTSKADGMHEAAQELGARTILMTKGLRGAFDWVEAHGDLWFRTPCLRSAVRVDDWIVKELIKELDSHSVYDRAEQSDISAWFNSKVGMDGRLSNAHPVTSFWTFVRKQVERIEGIKPGTRKPDLGRLDKWQSFVEALEALERNVVRHKWIMTFFDRMIESEVIKVNTKSTSHLMPASVKFNLSHPVAALAPERFAAAFYPQ